jgi:RHH-type transcriptional regulator, proline utilization regulon repressor / proline dehydrogenase / delta 1-pyrroline-5-carboxylate dehydrogenase
MGHQFVMGRDHRRGAGALAQGRQRRLPLFLRHARRGRADRARRARATCRPTAARSRRSAQVAAREIPPSVRRALDLGQALGAASALRARQARAGAGRTRAAGAGAGAAGEGQGIGFTVDAEEADRLELSLDVFAAAYADPSLDGWEGCGLAVQAYQKRAPAVIDYVIDLARRHGRRIPVRLVKGAYWDSEVKRAQVDGTPATRCSPASRTPTSATWPARRMFEATDALYPMFATHNAHTIAAIHRMASLHLPPAAHAYEFQKLHGMGDDLYAEVIPADRLGVPCRVYAPVGSHEDLLPYLVRACWRTAPTPASSTASPTRRSRSDLVRDPVETVAGFVAAGQAAHPRIPLPVALFRSQGHERGNSMGVNLANDDRLRELAEQHQRRPAQRLERRAAGAGRTLVRGHGRGDQPGRPSPPGRALAAGRRRHRRARARQRGRRAARAGTPPRPPAAPRSSSTPPTCSNSACRSSSRCARARPARPFPTESPKCARPSTSCATTRCRRAAVRRIEPLPGPTGESNSCSCTGAGVRVHQPVELPAGDLHRPGGRRAAAGNAVIAKPAEQTNAGRVLRGRLLHEAGVPDDVLQLLPGDGASVGAALTSDPRVPASLHRFGTETARAINRALAGREAPIAVLIAETGGQNALIADSSALPEQLVKDAMISRPSPRPASAARRRACCSCSRRRRQGDRRCWAARWPS